MLKKIVLLLAMQVLICYNGMAEVRYVEVGTVRLYYHYMPSKKPNRGLVVFLHGSVSAYKNKAVSEAVGVAELLEGNVDFLPTLEEQGYDVVLPIAHNEYNWLELKGNVLIDSVIGRYAQQYEHVYISGFSDGGTGAYRQYYGNRYGYSGLIVFNGYPQLGNFHTKVRYERHKGKSVVFVSQANDKVVPYEFLLTEYRRQKVTNAATYMLITEGKHEFVSYKKRDIERIIGLVKEGAPKDMLDGEEDSVWVYAPVDGYMRHDSVLEVYSYRARVCKGYGMKAEEYGAKPDVRAGCIIKPIKVAKERLSEPSFIFECIEDGKQKSVRITNYLQQKAW